MVQRLLAFGIVLALAFGLCARSQGQCVVGTNAGLDFDGINDGVVIPAPPASGLDGFVDFCVECWFAAAPSASANFKLVAKWGSGSYPWDLSVVNGQIEVWLNTTQVFIAPPGSADLRDNSWHHVALVRQTGLVSVFLDGLPYGNPVTFAATLVVGATPVTIGKRGDTAFVQFFRGKLDEVRIWSLARTTAQVQATKNVGLVGNEPGLVGYWRFDEGGSQQAVLNSASATGASLNGTLGATNLPGSDDPMRITTGLAPILYCPPCPTPPCGQLNSACATLLVNGVGTNAQGPLAVPAPAGTTLSLAWSGPANQPILLTASPNLIPGQALGGGLIADVNLGAYVVLLNGLDPVTGPLFWTNSAGTAAQTFGVPTLAAGATLSVQGAVFNYALSCPGGNLVMTTASFVIQF